MSQRFTALRHRVCSPTKDALLSVSMVHVSYHSFITRRVFSLFLIVSLLSIPADLRTHAIISWTRNDAVFFHSLFSFPTIFGRFCFSFGNVSLWSLKDGRVVTARAHCSDNWVSWRMFGLAAVRARVRRAVCNIYAIICLWTRRKKRTNTSTKLESVMWEKTILWCVHNKTRNAENSIIIVRWWLKNVSCIKCQKCFFFLLSTRFRFRVSIFISIEIFIQRRRWRWSGLLKTAHNAIGIAFISMRQCVISSRFLTAKWNSMLKFHHNRFWPLAVKVKEQTRCASRVFVCYVFSSVFFLYFNAVRCFAFVWILVFRHFRKQLTTFFICT